MLLNVFILCSFYWSVDGVLNFHPILNQKLIISLSAPNPITIFSHYADDLIVPPTYSIYLQFAFISMFCPKLTPSPYIIVSFNHIYYPWLLPSFCHSLYLIIANTIFTILYTDKIVTNPQTLLTPITNIQTTWKLPSGSQQWLPEALRMEFVTFGLSDILLAMVDE